MGRGGYALERFGRRFAPMADDPVRTALFEGWDIDNAKYGGGTTDHVWSGGPLTAIVERFCGIRPLEAGRGRFAVAPARDLMPRASISLPTVAGDIRVSRRPVKRGWKLRLTVPGGRPPAWPCPEGLPPLTKPGSIRSASADNGGISGRAWRMRCRTDRRLGSRLRKRRRPHRRRGPGGGSAGEQGRPRPAGMRRRRSMHVFVDEIAHEADRKSVV